MEAGLLVLRLVQGRRRKSCELVAGFIPLAKVQVLGVMVSQMWL